ncbi:MAG: phage tail sheath family protein [Jatrophihabitantaceae bacterium]
MTTGLRLGAPGVYPAPRRPEAALSAVRLDIAGFVGVALRGPVDSPVPVASWTDFERRFGGFERPAGAPDRLLPYAVQAFFGQGGERAYIVRVAPPPGAVGVTADAATARFRIGPVIAQAADEGAWANLLVASLSFSVEQTIRIGDGGPIQLDIPDGVNLTAPSLLRIRRPDLPAGGVFRWLTSVQFRAGPARRYAVLDSPLPVLESQATARALELDVITGTMTISDTSSAVPRGEIFSGLGLHPAHPRFLGTVLLSDSILLAPAGSWEPVMPESALLSPLPAERIQDGRDRFAGIGYGSFFDDGAAEDDPLDEFAVHRGVDAIGRQPDLGLLSVPDLCWFATDPAPAAPPPAVVRQDCRCRWCETEQVEPDYQAPAPVPRGLDARDPADLAEILRRQLRLVAVAVLRRRFVALLDVPDGLSIREVTNWRTRFDSSYAAAYHPWLGVPRAGDRERVAVPVPPSAFAAGIIASRERRLGLPWGPANELALGAVLATSVVTDAEHDQLHPLGINVYRAERDGFRLTAARTLSTDAAYRQLSVRRLMTMIALSIEQQMQWLVFEPNTDALRTRLRNNLILFLRRLYRRNAFAGATEAESFFVSCDAALNPPRSQALGRLVAEVGVAPAAPLEYLVLRISQDIDGAVTVVSAND